MMNTFNYIQTIATSRNRKLLIAVALLLATSLGAMALKKADSKPATIQSEAEAPATSMRAALHAHLRQTLHTFSG